MSEYSPAPGTPQTYAKAIGGAVVAFIIAAGPLLWVALDQNSDNGEDISQQEAVGIILAGLGAPVATGFTVAKIKNKPKRGREVVPR